MADDFYTREDIEFMSDVDAAILRRGHPLAYLLSTVVFVMFAVALVWAHFAVLDEVTRGMGQVVPSRKVQDIQNLEGGILAELMVAEGQIVDQGDILARIDNVLAQSNYDDAAARALMHRAAIARLTAEVEGGSPIFPEDVTAKAPQAMADQQATFRARREQQEHEFRALTSQYEQKMQEVEEMRSRKAQLEQNLKLAVEQRDIARPLMERQVYPRVDYLVLEKNVLTLKGDIEALRLGIPRMLRGAQEAQERMAERRAELRANALEELNVHRNELRSLEQTLATGADRVTRTDMRSPVRGTVKQIKSNTIGGVVRPGESIMQIVPMDDSLLIEARVKPADIAFLHAGQKATVKITAYDFAIYGGLEGFVSQISADTIEDQRGNTYYLVKVRTTCNTLNYKGEKLPIIPGMTASVDVLTGHKTVLDYLLKPILKAKQNALRER
ncbi:MAG: HlyD family type I secretion periplasmic adaptor subunit [Desulfovibrionaceae bacterium]